MTESMDAIFPEDEFSYDGWLVFNGLFSIEVNDPIQSPDELIETLSQYEEPEAGVNAEGYQRGDFDDRLQTAGDITWSLQRLGERLYPFKYKQTQWKTQSGVDQDGNRQTFKQPKHDGVDIFWDTDQDLMVFRGQKAFLSQNRKELRGGLSEKVKIEKLTFDHDFFLWMLYKKFIGQGLTSDLSIRDVSTLETTSDSIDNTGQGVRVQNSKNILRSVPAITAILDQKKPRELECEFILDNQAVRAQIEFGGKVHVKVTDSEMEELSDLRRMGISLQFIFELLHQYQTWDRLGPTEKYPPEKFFYNLAEVAKEEGYELTGQLKRVPEEYKRKREGRMVDGDIPRESGKDAT